MNSSLQPDLGPSKYSVMLPCEPDQFRDFIGGLLGKPQTITQQMRGIFEVKKQELVNFHHLICQRVEQQNHATLLQFTARIVFKDGTSVLLNDFDDLLNYHEVRPVVSTQVHLSWLFLIQFQDRKTPEKQMIDVSFIAEGKGSISYDKGDELLEQLIKKLGKW